MQKTSATSRAGMFAGLLVLAFVGLTPAEAKASQSEAEQLAEQRNEHGLLLLSEGALDEAGRAFMSAATLAEGKNRPPQPNRASLRYRLNAIRVWVEAGDRPQALKALNDILAATGELAGSAPELNLAAADLYRRLVNELDAPASYRRSAYDLLEQTITAATPADHATASWAYGYQAALMEDERRYDDAVQLNRRAIASAQQTPGTAGLFRWQWQLGRNLAELGHPEEAILSYAQAAESLKAERPALQTRRDSYADVFRPLYYQYAGLLLAEAADASDTLTRQNLLLQVQNTLETVKTVEIEDYFQEKCLVDEAAARNGIEPGTAVLYPIILDDRLDLIVGTQDELAHISVKVDRSQLIEAVRDFRVNVQVDTATLDYLRLAQRLYGWILEPVDEWLQTRNIQTLVFIPEGALRTIPIAALHDGKQFAVERFAMATAPSLDLVGKTTASSDLRNAFVSGLSTAVQGYSALPAVSEELATIEQLLPSRVLKDADFTTQALQQELAGGNYSVIHLATHGQFRSSYADSFLLTHDSRLMLDQLGDALSIRQARFGQLDLLVLSACETAAGDDRAALGVAGVAIKSGARSAVASLWEVDDAATKELIASFYKTMLAQPSGSKASHLQQAQKSLLNNADYRHPSNWAPFLIIGDWT